MNMPPTGSWEVRGGWVVNQLVADLGLTHIQAAGLVGNLGHESIGFTTLQEIVPLVRGSKGGFGWAQWTGPRRRAFEAWAAARGLVVTSDEANYGFLLEELRGAYRQFTARLRQTRTLAEASRLTHIQYETPHDVLTGTFTSAASRFNWAQRALNGATTHAAVSQERRATLERLVEMASEFQEALRAAGFDPGPTDGAIGQLSSDAAMEMWREWRRG